MGEHTEINLCSAQTVCLRSRPDFEIPHEVEDCFIIIIKLSQRNVYGETDAMIHKQEAVCRKCFQMLGEVDNVLMVKCECRFTLIHTTCSIECSAILSKCDGCQQIMQTVPISLLDPIRSKPATISNSHMSGKETAGSCSIL